MIYDADFEPGKDSLAVRLIKKVLDLSEEQQVSLLKQLDETSTAGYFSSERDDSRKSFKEIIMFTVKDQTYTGTSQDISAGGMFIETGDTFTVGQTIILSIPLANKQKTIKVPAQIVRAMPEGIGVEFLKKIG